MRAVIACGSGRYADPWHPFQRTSDRLAELLESAGFRVETHPVDVAVTRLAGAGLLVVNAGDPWRSEVTDPVPTEATEGLAAALERGIGVLAVHSAVASLRDHAGWAAATGAVWIPGCSWHPPLGRLEVRGSVLPDGSRINDFDVDDERYVGLQQVGERHLAARFVVAGTEHPAAWVRRAGHARVAVDLLGHDERSYDSAGHRALVARLVSWVVDAGAVGGAR